MAEIQEGGNKKSNSKQKKMTVRVDFTPMDEHVADYFLYAVYHPE